MTSIGTSVKAAILSRAPRDGSRYIVCPVCEVSAKHAVNRRRKSMNVRAEHDHVLYICHNCGEKGRINKLEQGNDFGATQGSTRKPWDRSRSGGAVRMGDKARRFRQF
jgi:RNase P subunit RPR2